MTIFSLYFPIFLSLSLSFLLPTIFNLFKKNIHHVLGLATTFYIDKLHLNSHNHISPLAAGLGITTFTKDVERLPNVSESETVKSAPPLVPTATIERDTGARPIGFMDDIGVKVNDGLISCMESLGSESSDERRVDYGIEEVNNIGDDYDCRRMRMTESRGRWRRDSYGKNEVKSFPPPLSSLNRIGQPSFFLRPLRKDGRLELIEVRIDRPEILHASRENGRLRLHLVPDENFLDNLEEEEEEEGEEQMQEQKEDGRLRLRLVPDESSLDDLKEEEEEELIQEQEEDIIEMEKDEKKEVEEIKYMREWSLGMRCHEIVNHHHHRVHGSHHHHMRICGVSIV